MNKKRKLIINFSAISLTDIVLLLLIFFLLSSSYVTNSGLKIDLPKTISSDKTLKETITVSITKENDLYLNQDKLMDLDELKIKSSSLLESSPNKIVLLKSDKNIPIDFVITIIDALKLSGAESVTIATIEDNWWK